MSGNRREYTLKAGQTLSEGLQFTAKSVIVDNPNSYYIWFPLIRRWVAPFTNGAVLSYGAYPSVASVETDLLPAGILPITNPQDVGAKLVFTEEMIPESGGSVTSVGVSGGNLLASLEQDVTGTQSASIKIPSGTLTLAGSIIVQALGTGGSLLITGDQTHTPYYIMDSFQAINQPASMPFYLLFQPADLSITITMSSIGNEHVTVKIYAISQPQAVRIDSGYLNEVNVVLQSVSQQVVLSTDNWPKNLQSLRLVSVAAPAPANTTYLILAGIAQKRIRLWHWNPVFTTAGDTPSIFLTDSSAVAGLISETYGPTNVLQQIPLYGYTLPVGSGLYLNSFNSGSIRGSLLYSFV